MNPNEDTTDPMPGTVVNVPQSEGPGVVDPDAFWTDFLSRLIRVSGASMVLVLVRSGTEWTVIRRGISRSVQKGGGAERFELLASDLAGQLSMDESRSFELEPGSPARVVGRLFGGMGGDRIGAALLLFSTPVEETVARAEGLVGFAVETPVAYDLRRRLGVTEGKLDRILGVLDGVATILPRQRFRDASIALCNRIASDLDAELTFLGWNLEGSAKVAAISRTESFNRKMNLVELIEKAMDECIDQEDPVRAPGDESTGTVNRVHSDAVRTGGFGHLLSVPLRDNGETVAVLTVQRSDRPFDPDEIERVNLLLDLVSPRLASLRTTDRWLGARMASGARRFFAGIVGPTHTWTKVAAVLGAVAFGFLLLFKMPHRVEGAFTLKSERLRNVPSPFDGFLDEVLVAPGDAVTEGQILARLDDEDIRLERDAAAAEVRRYRREAEMARVRGESAEMRIAEAMAAEAQARMEIAEYRLVRATLRAPVAGIVLEGDLRERIDAPVRQGDLLFTLAPPGPLYADATVMERDIHRVEVGAGGEIALVARPEERIPCRVVRIEPSGYPGEAGNVFTVRLEADDQMGWWRPGMGGVVKIDGEEKSVIEILTWRTVDFLRMYFWF